MATRPLDAAFGGSTEKKSKKRGALLAVGIVAGLASIGSIFAASVSINSNNAISFSQGTTTIAACDSAIGATLGAFYDEGYSAFSLDTITLTGVDAACDGKTLTLNLYQGTTPLVDVTGTIALGGGTDIVVGVADTALPEEDPTVPNLTTPVVTYGPSKTAQDLAASADRIVIEIN